MSCACVLQSRANVYEMRARDKGRRDEAVARLRATLGAAAVRPLSEPRLRAAFQGEGMTVKNDRYLLPVKAEYRSWVHGPIRDRSQSGATLKRGKRC